MYWAYVAYLYSMWCEERSLAIARDGAQPLGQPQGVGQLFRHYAGPAAGTHVREQHDHGVGFERRLGVPTGGVQQAVDDAPVLHIRRQQAERDAPDLGPGDPVALA